MNTYNDVTIIIPTYNRKTDLDVCIASILKQSYKYFNIVVIDDDSSDGTHDYINNKYPFVKLIRNDKNRGVNYSRNVGIASTRSTYILILDSDMELINPDQIATMVKIMSSDSTIGQVGGIYQDPDFMIWGCAFDGTKVYAPNENILQECDYVSSGNLFMRRVTLLDAGGFDEFIVGDGTECEMGMNLKRNGLRNVVAVCVAAQHHMSSHERNNIGLNLTTKHSEVSKHHMRLLYQNRNRLRYYFKYGHFQDAAQYIWRSGFINIISLLAFIKQHLCGLKHAQSEQYDTWPQKWNALFFKMRIIVDPILWNMIHWAQTLRSRKIDFLSNKESDLC